MVSSSVDSESGLPKSKTLKASEKLLGKKLENLGKVLRGGVFIWFLDPDLI
jgi:hypothetical protein